MAPEASHLAHVTSIVDCTCLYHWQWLVFHSGRFSWRVLHNPLPIRGCISPSCFSCSSAVRAWCRASANVAADVRFPATSTRVLARRGLVSTLPPPHPSCVHSSPQTTSQTPSQNCPHTPQIFASSSKAEQTKEPPSWLVELGLGSQVKDRFLIRWQDIVDPFSLPPQV